MELPGALSAALARALEGVSRTELARHTQATSLAYRAGGTSAPVIRDAVSALAYAVARMPATYAACGRVMDELVRVAPGFAPASLLDAGSGPGTASWAAVDAYRSLAQVTWLDANVPLLELASRLAAGGPQALATAKVLRGDLVSKDLPRADLVVASYALAEVAPPVQADLVRRLWDASAGVLALIEPGTTAGYARLMLARSALIAEGGVLLAPCPHAEACPLAAPDWCHFSVRLPRSRDHRIAKAADAPFEDEKFAYLLVARPHVTAHAAEARILARPRMGKAGIELKLCGTTGLEHRLVGRREKPGFAKVRRLDWGDVYA